MKRHSMTYHLPWRLVLSYLVCLAMMLPSSFTAWAALGEDQEKPKLEFSIEGKTITAKLIPRGKRTNIQIDFGVSGGKLDSVEAMDFAEAERPEVDKKDFRSALFVIKAGGIPPGGEIEVSMASNYFTKSTQFWVFNPSASTPWSAVEAKHVGLPERVEELRIAVKDGGPLDSDGKANGEIVLICGPVDAFWGYAIGTLFIRFFGVFMVLAMLQIGMNVASKIFRAIEDRVDRAKAEAAAAVAAIAVPEPDAARPPMDRSIAAVIAMALHLHLSHERAAEALQLASPEVSAWSHHGRARIMSDRSLIFDRNNRPDSTRLSR
jgi:hypothetical protein